MPTSLSTQTVTAIAQGLRENTFSSEDLVRSCLVAIEKQDATSHAFLTVDTEGAIAAAKTIDARRAAGEQLDPLAGIPVAVKDIIATDGIRTTAASKMLEDYVPSFDATAIARLKARGMIVIGKTNLDEFAHGASTERSAFGPTRNPWDTTRVPGGSSGGSAVAVATGMAPLAFGTDTGGSTRYPAAFCGVVGLKPTYGRISRYGLFSMTSSTDCVAPMGRTVEDAAALLGAVAGEDALDATSAAIPVPDYRAALTGTVKGLRIGIPKEFFPKGLRAEVQTALDVAITHLESLGAEVVPVSLPHTEYGVPVYYIVTPCEISSNLGRFDGIRYSGMRAKENAHAAALEDFYRGVRAGGFGPEPKRRIMLGTYALSAGYYDAYYRKAQQVRTLIRRDFDRAFESVDVLVTPTAPHPAFKLGAKLDDPLQLYLEDIFVTTASLAGLPAISVPCGMSDQEGIQLPLGMQIIGKHFDESTILRVAHAYEQTTPWHTMSPVL